jgi:two-component system sensor histidine kinase YesM
MIPNAGLYLITITSMREILRPINTLQSSILLMSIITGLVAFVAAFFISRSIPNKINNLSRALQSVQNGDFSISLPIVSTDEIGELTASFNYMTVKLSQMAAEQYDLGVQAQKSEFLALQSQINPHFLYNTLDMIHWAAIERESQEISNIVIALSRFYKLSLGDGTSFVKVKDEVEHIRLYLSIMRQRFDNEFSFSLDIKPDILECVVVKIILQPIVENSVLHGISQNTPKHGHIWISAYREGDDILFIIRDDGVGIPEEKLKNLLNDDGAGYGVRSIDRRIKLYYGDTYGLTCQSEPNTGTTTTIRVPYQ